jgi:hypothetical protein
MLVLYPWLTTAHGGGWGKRAFDIMSVDESTGARPGYAAALVATLPGARLALRVVGIFSPIGRRALARLSSTHLAVVRRSCSIQHYERGWWQGDPRSPIPLERERRAVLAPRGVRDRVLTVGGAGKWIGGSMLAVAAVYATGWIVYNAWWLFSHWF